MKRCTDFHIRGKFYKFKKPILIMKFSIILLLLGVLQVSAAVYSQNSRLTASFKDQSVKEVLNQIEKSTEFRFFYNENFTDLNRKVTITAQNENINEFLDYLLASTNVTYKVLENNLIVITPKGLLQQNKITGKVIDANTNEPLPGVNVVVVGTNTGTITNISGEYSIEVPNEKAVLKFSFIGYSAQEVPVGGKTVIDVTLAPAAIDLNEVVVTALGIERNKRTLSYATQQVKMDAITTVKDISLGNALSGKIAGVSVTTSSGASGVGGSSRIIIRGDRSINYNEQPLVVVDGVPTNVGLDAINPDDVESMNVLKGASASALYGSVAANGVILVTTKKGKVGETKVEVNSLASFDLPYLYPHIQNVYGQGTDGTFSPNIEYYSWGPKMEGQTVTDWTGKEKAFSPQPNNIKDFFRTGYNYTNTISYSTGNQKSTAYFSYTNTTAEGVIPVNKLERHNLNMRLNTELVKNLRLDAVITWVRGTTKNSPKTGDDLFSPMWQLVKMPRSIRTADIEDACYYDETGSLKQLVWAEEPIGNINPYWSTRGRYQQSNGSSLNTVASLRYDFFPWLYLQLRGRMSTNNGDSEEEKYCDTQYINSGDGDYTRQYSKSQYLNGDVLLGIDKDLTTNWHLSANLGAEIKDYKGSSLKSDTGPLSLENKFFIANGTGISTSDAESHTQTQSVYGTAQIGFHNYLFLDMSGRNDWNSTLPSPYDYFYPSIGLTGVVSDMVTLPSFISFVKVRGTYAEVGNGANFAQIFQTFSRDVNGSVGMVYPNSTKVADKLIPERTKSWEAGTELRFLQDKIGLDFTWYKSNTYNQLVQITTGPTSGYAAAYINCGNIQNTGVEIMLTAVPVQTNSFRWDVNLNFARNKNEVKSLTSNVTEYELSAPNLSMGDDWVIVGKPYGEILSRGFQRTDDGRIIVDASGVPKITTDAKTILGNFNYDWRSGLTNTFRYKNWDLYFLIDLNYGGVRQSATESTMLSCGTSTASLKGRDGFVYPGVKEVDNGDGTVSYVDNDIVVTAEVYGKAMGGRATNGCGEAFNHKATNSRLRELSVGYTLPIKSNLVKSIRVSAVGRNLFYIYNACDWFDPDGSYDISTNGQGAECAFLPGCRNIGLNIKMTF